MCQNTTALLEGKGIIKGCDEFAYLGVIIEKDAGQVDDF